MNRLRRLPLTNLPRVAVTDIRPFDPAATTRNAEHSTSEADNLQRPFSVVAQPIKNGSTCRLIPYPFVDSRHDTLFGYGSFGIDS